MSETITATTSVESVDPTTLQPVVVTTTHLTSKARVKYAFSRVTDRETGTQTVGVEEVEIHFPSGTVIDPDWVLTVTASTADAGIVGRVYRAKSRGVAGQTTALRVAVEEVS